MLKEEGISLRQGTISVLFGCHSQFHSIVVILAWKKWWGSWPSFWQFICIILHDIGHWGKDYLNDYEEKKRHAELGAKVAGVLFGQKGYNLVSGHNSYNHETRSQLYAPDKYSWELAPVWWLMSNQIFEPKLIRKGRGRRESAVMFKEAMRENRKLGFKEHGHDIYLKQWGHSQKT